MEGKKSVVLYVDVISTFEGLDDAEAGRLIKHFLRYVNDLNPEPPDKLTQIAFEPIKQQLKRDLIKWNSIIDNRSKSGKKGGLASVEARRSKVKQNQASASDDKQSQANQAVIDNVTVNVNKKKAATQPSLSTDEQERWNKVLEFIKDTAPTLLTFRDPLTLPQFIKLKEDYDVDEIEETMRALDNKVDANKKYSSVYKTLVNWIKMGRKRKMTTI